MWRLLGMNPVDVEQLKNFIDENNHKLARMEEEGRKLREQAMLVVSDFAKHCVDIIRDYGSASKDGLGLLLISAAFLGDFGVVKVVLSLSKDVGDFGPLCASIAAGLGHMELVMLLLSSRIEWFTAKFFETSRMPYPLALAAYNNHYAVVEVLLPHTPDHVLDRLSIEGMVPTLLTPLAKMNLLDMLRLLLQRKPNLEVWDASTKDTALTAACFEGYFDCAQLLINAGAVVNTNGIMGATPVQMAAANGHVQLLKLLLDSGGTVNKGGELLGPAIILAARASPLNTHCEEFARDFDNVVRLLLVRKADVNAVHGLTCETALISACEHGQESIAKQLVLAGAHPYLRDVRGKCAFDFPKVFNCAAFMQSLENAGTNRRLRKLELLNRKKLESGALFIVPAVEEPQKIVEKLGKKKASKQRKKKSKNAKKKVVKQGNDAKVEEHVDNISEVSEEKHHVEVVSEEKSRATSVFIIEQENVVLTKADVVVEAAPVEEACCLLSAKLNGVPRGGDLRKFPLSAQGIPDGIYFVCIVPDKLYEMVGNEKLLSKVWAAIHSGRMLLPASRDKAGIKVISPIERKELKGTFRSATHKIKLNREDFRVFLRADILVENGKHEVCLNPIGVNFHPH